MSKGLALVMLIHWHCVSALTYVHAGAGHPVAAYLPGHSASRSLRSRHARAAMQADDDDASPLGGLQKALGINRDAPEARANQMEWARQQMDLEVPDATLEGKSIENRADFIAQYIQSEKEKFGREIDESAAAEEVDAWLLSQATNASSKSSPMDAVAAVAVFLLAFGGTIFMAAPK
jgi:hypothetical protein